MKISDETTYTRNIKSSITKCYCLPKISTIRKINLEDSSTQTIDWMEEESFVL
jgi:hypothetical protein